MKYKSVLCSDSCTTTMNIECSHCGKSLDGDENFCPKCGAKLFKLPKSINGKILLEILTEILKNKTFKCDGIFVGDINLGRDSVSTKPTDDPSVATFTAPSDWRATMQEEAKPHCLHGDHKPESCGHCTKNGACDATVLTSFPPQYNMCPFRGSGFIYCQDA